jgi:hypothetical protein
MASRRILSWQASQIPPFKVTVGLAHTMHFLADSVIRAYLRSSDSAALINYFYLFGMFKDHF